MIEVDVWADVRCPWCWIGLRRFRRAVEMVEQPVLVRRRSFLLEPKGPVSPGRPTVEVATTEWAIPAEQWAAKSEHIRSEGALEGLSIDVDGALMFDSALLHRLLKLAAEVHGVDAEEAWESAFAAHFERTEKLGDPAVLSRLASRWGVDGVEIDRALAGDRFAAEVARDLEDARRLSIHSVPTVIAADGRRVSGAATVDELARFLATTGSLR
ncbi:thioredoxin domain-containing protein [Dietzia sp. B19]|uniref:DsbA family oxidoreductase n=1 Tax=Dietzia sp. B19 TaxID=1630632 RepID=UPI0015FB2D28|nr:DsbA family protein [Dietzia sp. B19]MBB1058659.1 thioredoxin domain-containing protein [Dietzia sp. B19]